ncbi:MAG: hypothetical protein ABIR70_19120 [Bryobacteraceae bacterium]
MKQALAALFGAGFTIAGCYAAGLVLMDRLRIRELLRQPERLALAFCLGASLVHLSVFALLAMQIAYWPVLVAVPLVAIVEASRRRLWRADGFELAGIPKQLKLVGGAVGAAFFAIYFIYAWAPEHSPDGSAYHLGLVARELRAHGFEKITTTIYAMLGQGIELVYLPAFAIGRHSSAALVHLGFAVSLALLIFTFGRRLGKPWVGAAAALMTFASPVFGIAASSAYIDAGAAAVVFAVFYWLEIWDQERTVREDAWRLLIPVGLLAGYAYAAKYTTFPIGIYALGFVAWKTRRWKPVALVAVCGALMAGPWIARNTLLYENPAAPLANDLFRNPYTHVMFERDYSQYLRTYSVTDKTSLPLEVTVRGEKTQGLIGPMFLLLPIGLFALRRRTGRHVWLAGVLVFLPYFANIGTRFLIPCLPFFSLSIALALGEAPVLLGGLILLHGALSWPTTVPHYAAEHAWRMDGVPLRAALRLQDTNEFLTQTINPGYAAARMISGNVPKGEAVLTQGGVPDAYADREILVSFQSASNEVAMDIFHMGWLVGNQPIRAHSFRFAETRARRMRLQQTAVTPASEQWNVHEMRFFRQGVELTRRPEWRLQAWPMPWDVQMAFDNSGATRWRSWETPAPGMFLEVDFGRDEVVDEIRVETSSDSVSVRLQPEVIIEGAWQPLAAKLESKDVGPNLNARRMATYELHLRGIHYLLLFDSDFGAQDVRDDPEAWGLKQVAKADGARLYKTTW